MRKNYQKLVITFLLIIAFTFSAAAAQIQTSPNANQINLATDVFDGYSGIEVTDYGLLGYNYAISIPNGEELLFGFDPRTINDDQCSYLNIAHGWDIKLPRISDFTLTTLRGYQIPIDELEINTEQGNYILNEGYGRKTIFSSSGLIKSVIDEFDNTTTYQYIDGKLSKILYTDGSIISFDRNDNALSILYSFEDEADSVLATFNTTSECKLSSIVGVADTAHFDYLDGSNSTPILLKSYELQNEYTKQFTYTKRTSDPTNEYARVSTINTIYPDGITETYQYSYNTQEQLCSISFGNGFLIEYEYSTDARNNKTVQQTKHTPSTVSVTSYTQNISGQITEYVSNQNKIQIEYNDNNKITSINDNGNITSYTYNTNGLPISSITPDGIISEFIYDTNGKLKAKKVHTGETFYSNSDTQNTLISPTNSASDLFNAPLRRASWSVQYKLPNGTNNVYSIGVTNFLAAYGLKDGSCNCYGFAMGRYTDHKNPGQHAGKNYNSMLWDNINTLKLAVEEDQSALGHYSFDCNVSTSFSSHQWKIVMRTRIGYDYHFMKQSYQGPWMFKAGNSGSVMQLLNNLTPERVTWDSYDFNFSTNRYQVQFSNCYLAPTYYMIIQG